LLFADSPTAETTVHIEVPPAAVWPFVIDLDVLARFSGEFQGGEWLDGFTSPALGSRFAGRNRMGESAWRVTCTVTDWEPNRTFGWCVQDPDNPAATWRFSLYPDGKGTRLLYSARMGPGSSGVTAAIDARPESEERIIDHRLAVWTANMEATVAGIRSLAVTDLDLD
jgi:uncharacterized protein YndB with AHSA1/START domain